MPIVDLVMSHLVGESRCIAHAHRFHRKPVPHPFRLPSFADTIRRAYGTRQPSRAIGDDHRTPPPRPIRASATSHSPTTNGALACDHSSRTATLVNSNPTSVLTVGTPHGHGGRRVTIAPPDRDGDADRNAAGRRRRRRSASGMLGSEPRRRVTILLPCRRGSGPLRRGPGHHLALQSRSNSTSPTVTHGVR